MKKKTTREARQGREGKESTWNVGNACGGVVENEDGEENDTSLGRMNPKKKKRTGK